MLSATTIRKSDHFFGTTTLSLSDEAEKDPFHLPFSIDFPLIEGAPELVALDKPRLEQVEPRAQRGLGGITSYGKRIVRSGACWLEKSFGRKHLSFITFTFPPDCWLIQNMNRRLYSEVIGKFRRRLSDSLMSAGLPSYIVGVTEMQMQRFERDGVPAWHGHFVTVGRNPGKTWGLTPQQISDCWNGCLLEYEDDCEVKREWKSSTNVSRVKKSAAGYLGKYMSKGRKDIAKIRETLSDDQIPASWYVLTRNLGDEIQKATIRLSGEAASFVLNFLLDNKERFLNFERRILWTAPDGTSVPVGWYGYLKVPWDEIF
jgi:hypothetical protein